VSAQITYGIGGYIADHPNGNIVEQTVDNGDGTGTRTTYTPAPIHISEPPRLGMISYTIFSMQKKNQTNYKLKI